MSQLSDKISILVFDAIAAARGYRFVQATTHKQLDDINNVYAEDGFTFPRELHEKVKFYNVGTISFIAYYNNKPVGTVRLGNPKIVNRPLELYGVDENGAHFEIQNLCVKKAYRDGSQFVMLGLFRAMYAYSVRHGINSWNSCGTRNVYMTIRRYCKKIEVLDIDFSNINHPLTRYLYTNNIIDTYFTIEVAAFEPWAILRRFVKQLSKKWELPEFFKPRTTRIASII